MAAPRICSVPDCGKPVSTRDLCRRHYQRWRVHGDPLFASGTERGEPEKFLVDVVLTYEGDDCLRWPFNVNSHGYGLLWQKGSSRMVSRQVCEAAHGPAPSPTHHAAHSCGKGHEACVTKRHLHWALPVQNQAEMVAHGNSQRGEKSFRAKLTKEDVRQIREMSKTTSQEELGRMFGVNSANIWAILNRRSWAWLD